MEFNLKKNYQTIFLISLSIIIIVQIIYLVNECDDTSDAEDLYDNAVQETGINNVDNNFTQHDKLLKYGSPHDIFDEQESRMMFWKLKNDPWYNLYYNSTNNKFTFGLKSQMTKKLLKEWQNIIPNIGFNDKENLIMFTTEDENSALAVANLVLSTIHDELTIKDINDSNLLQISLNKIRSHPLVKTKILEQINEKISNNETIKTEDTTDLATIGNMNTLGDLNIDAYGGNEFSFLN
jgi:hypothetical protein